MAEYKVTLSLNEVVYVDAENESEALRKAYAAAEHNVVWDEADIEEIEADEE